LLASTLVVLLFPKEAKFKYEFQKNKPWVHQDLLAPFDFAINKTAKELNSERQQVASQNLYYFKSDNTVLTKATAKFQTWVNENWKDSLKTELKEVLFKQGVAYLNSIYTIGVIEVIYELDGKGKDYAVLIMDENNVGEELPLGKVYTIKSAYNFVQENLKKSTVPHADFLLLAIENSLQQSIKYNRALSEKDLKNELNSISLVKGGVYEKEKIISKGELVSEEKFVILESLKAEYESKLGDSNQSVLVVVGQVVLVLLLFYSIFIFLKNINLKVYNNNIDIGFITMVVVGFIAITTLVLKFEGLSVYAIPYCIIPLLIRTFFGNRLALFIYIISIYIISFIVPSPFEFILLESITGIITIFTVLDVNKRAALFYTSALIFVLFSITYLGFFLLQGGSFEAISWEVFGSFGMAAGLTLLTYPLIYLFEKLFGYISDVTLLELSDTNNELLRALNLKAPGTFQHSLQVSNLAEEGIREIGGNPLLVRAGALYHDIGKMLAPA
jgi:membrane-associated HD superfamily phosphohydrolase